jgi:hypothetical protein
MQSPRPRRRTVARLAAIGFVSGAALVFAASASAASLTSVSVSPVTIVKGKLFKITLKGTSDLTPPQRIVAWTQTRTPLCASNANAEFRRLNGKSPVIFRNLVPGASFNIQKSITSSALGKRRVCVYLYNTGFASFPLARGTAKYTVVLPLCRRGQTRGCRRR